MMEHAGRYVVWSFDCHGTPSHEVLYILALRIEWCRVRARAMRWSEEVLLLREEMRRVLVFLEWQATWWEKRAVSHVEWWAEQDGLASCPECDPATDYAGHNLVRQREMAAYAHRQAYISSQNSPLLLPFCSLGRGTRVHGDRPRASNDILDLNLTASLSLLISHPFPNHKQFFHRLFYSSFYPFPFYLCSLLPGCIIITCNLSTNLNSNILFFS